MATDDPTATPEPEGAIMNSGEQPQKEELDLVHEIEKKLAPTATPTGKSEIDPFDELKLRLMSATKRLRLAVNDIEFSECPEAHDPAVFVLQEAIEDLEKIRNELRAWGDTHEHTPKAPKEVQS